MSGVIFGILFLPPSDRSAARRPHLLPLYLLAPVSESEHGSSNFMRLSPILVVLDQLRTS
jgi:hypothetical protein